MCSNASRAEASSGSRSVGRHRGWSRGRQAEEALVIRLISVSIAATAVITAVRAALKPYGGRRTCDPFAGFDSLLTPPPVSLLAPWIEGAETGAGARPVYPGLRRIMQGSKRAFKPWAERPSLSSKQ